MRKDCPLQKQSNGGSGGGGGNDKTCSHCNKKGHESKDCWKLHPEKMPQWIKDKMNNKSTEAAGAGVEVMLSQVEVDETQDFWEACL